MGHPLAMDLQAYGHYPVHWLVVLAHLPYTLHTAAVLHGLHVLLGAVGARLFLRLSSPARLALAGACAFQFFGGFYSNAQHPDITRAFAWLPWLLWATSWCGGRFPSRALALPPLFALFATSSYAGNLIAFGWLLPLHAAAQAWRAPQPTTPKARAAWLAGVLALIALGLAMASASLGPVWWHRELLLRHEISSRLPKLGIDAAHLLGLFSSSRRLPGEPSMASSFITLPLVFGLALLTLSGLRRQLPALLLLLLALASAFGDDSPWRALLAGLAPPLGWSKLPSSDFRAVVAVMSIVLGLEGLRGLAEGRLSRRALLARSGVATLLLAFGTAVPLRWPSFPDVTPPVPEAAQLVVAAAALLLSVLAAIRIQRRGSLDRLSGAALLAGVLLHGAFVVADISFCWRFPEKLRVEALSSWNPSRTGASVLPRDGARPGREVPTLAGDYAWGGHIQGRYMMQDRGGATLQARARIQDEPRFFAYMLREWTPLWLPRATPGDSALRFDAARPLTPEVGSIRQLRYGPDESLYQVSLQRDATLLENEIHFPGWSAVLAGRGRAEPVHAFGVEGLFRAWELPRGEYQMRARFEMPSSRAFAALARAAWAAWLLLLLGAALAAHSSRRKQASRSRRAGS